MTVPGFVITVIGRVAPEVRGMSIDGGGHHGVVDRCLRERRRAVERSAHHRRGVGEIGDQLVAAHGQLDVQRDVADVDPVRVHVVGECRRPVGPGGDLGAEQPLRVVEEVGHQRGEPRGAVALRERLEAPVADVAGGDLGAEVADQLARDAHVGPDHGEEVLDRLAFGVEPDPRQPQALLEHLGVVAGARARHPAADVAVMGDRDGEAEQRLALEGRLDDEHVRRVARAVERVVDDVDVPGPEAVAEALEQRLDRVRDRAELQRDRHRLSDGLSGRPAERGREVHRVADDRRVRRAEDRGRHLVGGGLERVCDEPARDRVGVRALVAPLDRDVVEHERVRPRVDPDRPAGRDHHRRVVLVDEDRAGNGLDAERGAGADRGLERPVLRAEAREPGLGRQGGREVGAAGQRELLARRAERDHAHGADVDRRARLEARPVETLVLGLEPLGEQAQGIAVELSGEVDREAPVLAAVANVGEALPLDRAGVADRLGQCCAHLGVEAARASRSPARGRSPGRSARRGTRRGRRADRLRRRARRAAARPPCRPRARRPGPPREPGRSRRRRSARSRRGRGPSRSRRRAARASSSRWPGRGFPAPPRRSRGRAAHRASRPPARRARTRRSDRRRRAGRSGCSRGRRSRRSRSARCRRGRSKRAPGPRRRCGGRRAGRRRDRARRSSRRPRRPRRCRSSGFGSARRCRAGAGCRRRATRRPRTRGCGRRVRPRSARPSRSCRPCRR